MTIGGIPTEGTCRVKLPSTAPHPMIGGREVPVPGEWGGYFIVEWGSPSNHTLWGLARSLQTTRFDGLALWPGADEPRRVRGYVRLNVVEVRGSRALVHFMGVGEPQT
jgi:hypothetical protein